MLKWAQGAVAAVTGSAEPIYGAEAFMPVDKTVAGRNPYGKLEKADLAWEQPPQAHVETQTFYFTDPKSNYYGFCQLIHSNPVNLAFTSQFTFLLKKRDDPDYKLWTSTRLNGAAIVEDEDKTNFVAENFSITLNEAADEYAFKSAVTPESEVDVTFKRVGDGFKIGADGKSRYGEDLAQPWGTMRHVFWPRLDISGTIKTADAEIKLDHSQGLYVMALQGMKPHHAAASWNFCNFQGPTISAVVMEFTTPVSYGSSRSAIGAIHRDGELIATCIGTTTEHVDPVVDEVGWPAPKAIKFGLEGPKPGVANSQINDPANVVKAKVSGELNYLVDRVDVLAEIPAFVKRVVNGVSGANPYIYQYMNDMDVEVEVDGETIKEKGVGYVEVTFISET